MSRYAVGQAEIMPEFVAEYRFQTTRASVVYAGQVDQDFGRGVSVSACVAAAPSLLRVIDYLNVECGLRVGVVR
ncbi:hypothetical protein BKG59_19910 [Mycobacteroides chelonae]|nr:hypothetical protein AOT86_11830 [Mycobacteroides sp. H072]KRQ32687.1 hypothetical protein AOT84_21100 [Mycobacteroides sp. H002]KRQ54113.1 hypothetical protein AOT85_05600 [Mycobacteroides sp. H054]OHT48798.1 hypothetical protein BKG63_21820 [Mycobacteroides chelonae]OHT58321.1 hypothetical protein BKG64_16500 [Mycobacteroides chelonae]